MFFGGIVGDGLVLFCAGCQYSSQLMIATLLFRYNYNVFIMTRDRLNVSPL